MKKKDDLEQIPEHVLEAAKAAGIDEKDFRAALKRVDAMSPEEYARKKQLLADARRRLGAMAAPPLTKSKH